MASPSSALESEAADSVRFAGANRYETAAALATSPHWGLSSSCSPDVVIVNGENFPDGLSASVMGDRILLVKTDSIPSATRQAISDLMDLSKSVGCDGEVDIMVVGGPAAVSADVMGELDLLTNDNGGFVDYNGRLHGDNRYETAVQVAKWDDDCDSILARGDDFADALAAGQLADLESDPILLTSGDTLHPATLAYYEHIMDPDGDDCGIGNDIYIIGGTAAIPTSVELQLNAMGFNTERLAGADRYETAVAVAEAVYDETCCDDHSIVLVNGAAFPDALAAGTFPSISAVDGVVLFTQKDSVPEATLDFITDNCLTLGDDTDADLPDDGDAETDENVYGSVFAIGGTAVISDEALAEAAAATACGQAVDVLSATVGYSNIVDQVCLIDDDGGWTPGTTGPVLIPVPGSIASGLMPDVTTIEITGTDDPDDEIEPSSEWDGSTLTVELGQEENGISQADLAAAWAASGSAAQLFILVQGSDDPNLPPDSTDDLGVTCLDPEADMTIQITFNQKVGVAGDFDATPIAMLGDLGYLPAPDSASPLFGDTDADGNSVFTYVWEELTASYLFGGTPPIADSGDDFTLSADEVENSYGTNNDEIVVDFTAG
jgi:putative cell wall-binding protein